MPNFTTEKTVSGQENAFESLASEQQVDIDIERIRKPASEYSQQPILLESSDETSPSKLNWVSALLLGIFLFLMLGVYQALDVIYQAWEFSVVVGLILLTVLVSFVSVVGALIWKEIRSYKSISRIDQQQQAFEKIKTSQDLELWLKFFKHNQQMQKSPQASLAHHQFFSKLRPHHSLKEVQNLYQTQVTEPLKNLARQEIKKQVLASAALSGLSPNALIQTVALTWLHLKMVRRIAGFYGLRPGIQGQIRLSKMAFNALIVLGLTDMTTDVIMAELFGQGVLAKISSQSAEALISARLTYRLGEGLIDILWLDYHP